MKSKISSLNTNGIIGSIIFVEYLINNSDITFLQEHWLYNNNKYIIENLCKKNEKILFFSPMGDNPSKGRPWGGLCWIIKKEIKVINHEILDEGISVIDVKINENPLCIIGVYLKYNSSNTESNLKYQHQLRILEECIYKAKEMNTEFIIIGDFNGDIQRLRYLNDINLLNFINKTALESVNNQSLNIEYTYHKGVNKSVIDYLLVSKVNISKYKISVVENKYNTSDHCALLLELSIDNK